MYLVRGFLRATRNVPTSEFHDICSNWPQLRVVIIFHVTCGYMCPYKLLESSRITLCLYLDELFCSIWWGGFSCANKLYRISFVIFLRRHLRVARRLFPFNSTHWRVQISGSTSSMPRCVILYFLNVHNSLSRKQALSLFYSRQISEFYWHLKQSVSNMPEDYVSYIWITYLLFRVSS